MTREEWIKIYNAKDGTWDKYDLIDKAYEIISSPIKTNYDRIKSMSVKEMAEFFEGHFDCNFCPKSEILSDNPLLKYEKCDEKCIYHITQWLLQEVSENE